MRRVSDELALVFDGPVERRARGLQAVKHRVETTCELPNLISGANLDALGEIVGFADQLRGARDLGQRRENPPRCQPTQPGGQRHTGQANQQQDDPQLG